MGTQTGRLDETKSARASQYLKDTETHTHTRTPVRANTHTHTQGLHSSIINWITCLGQERPEHSSTNPPRRAESPQSSRVVLSLCRLLLQRCTACRVVEFRVIRECTQKPETHNVIRIARSTQRRPCSLQVLLVLTWKVLASAVSCAEAQHPSKPLTGGELKVC